MTADTLAWLSDVLAYALWTERLERLGISEKEAARLVNRAERKRSVHTCVEHIAGA